jgi:hypothetical protein
VGTHRKRYNWLDPYVAGSPFYSPDHRSLQKADGNVSAENYQDLTAIGGWNGYTSLMPIGVKPKDPSSDPKRPTDGEREG